MTAAVWKNRLAAGAVIGLIALSLPALIRILGDVGAVREAEARAAEAVQAIPAAPPVPQALQPILRRGATAADVAVGEYLNGRLSELGFGTTAVQVVSVRPLGRGLQLAEVRVEGSGDLASVAAVANWVAVNQEAVRLKSLSTSQTPDGAVRSSLVLLMVIA